MDIAVAMSGLRISHNKRRLSGLIRGMAPGNESPINSPVFSDTDSPTSSVSQTESVFTFSQPVDVPEAMEEVKPQTRRSSRHIKNVAVAAPVKPASSSFITFNPEEEITDKKELNALKKIYLNKNVKKLAPSLETIFETPTEDNKVMSNRKFKRLIKFPDLQKNKVKKLPMKAKQAAAKYIRNKKKSKMSMDEFMEKLKKLESD